MLKASLIVTTLALWLTVPVFAGDQDQKSAKSAKCICGSKTPQTVAWCKACKSGMAFNHKTKSRRMVTLLEGKEVSPDKFKCEGCRTAAAKGGSCCKKTFVNGRAYKTRVAAALSKGHVIDPGNVACGSCKTSAEKGQGYCDKCNAGIAGGMLFMGREDYEAAVNAQTVLVMAIEANDHCEKCAVAILIDGECKDCKVRFENGAKVGKDGLKSKKSG